MKFLDGFACPLAIQAWCFPSSLTSSDWAAWVQAIGSILAIFVAAGLVVFQHALAERKERKAERRASQARVDTALQLVRWATICCGRVRDFIELAPGIERDINHVNVLSDLRGLKSALERLDLNAFRGVDEIKPVVLTANALSALESYLNAAKISGLGAYEHFKPHIESIESQIEQQKTALAAIEFT
jgi:hypothetical protein